jgi:hypothetical protein
MPASPGSPEKSLFERSDSQKRCYHRIKTGCRWYKNDIFRFLTLGSSPNMKRGQQASFRNCFFLKVSGEPPLEGISLGAKVNSR